MLIKKKVINSQTYNKLISQNYEPFLAKIISARVSENQDLELVLKGSIKDLSSPFLFKDIQKAVDRLYQAVIDGEVIGLETDHDCDGQTSLLYRA